MNLRHYHSNKPACVICGRESLIGGNFFKWKKKRGSLSWRHPNAKVIEDFLGVDFIKNENQRLCAFCLRVFNEGLWRFVREYRIPNYLGSHWWEVLVNLKDRTPMLHLCCVEVILNVFKREIKCKHPG